MATIHDLTRSTAGLTEAGAHALRMENQQLKAQAQLFSQIIQQRGTQNVAVFLEGLQVLIAASRAGDVGARQQIKQLREAFDEMRLISLIKVPGQD